jgi:hypothetical protein
LVKNNNLKGHHSPASESEQNELHEERPTSSSFFLAFITMQPASPAMALSGMSDDVIDMVLWTYVGQALPGPWYLPGSKIRHGHGVCTYKLTGNKYEGEWKDDKKSGEGVYTWSNGSRYEGGWKDGKQSGQGLYTWPSGLQYEGGFKEDLRSGRGVQWLPGGCVFDGDFAEGFPLRGTVMESGGVLFSLNFISKTHLEDALSLDAAERTPAGRVVMGCPPQKGEIGRAAAVWNAQVELPCGTLVEGRFCGLQPDGPWRLVEAQSTSAPHNHMPVRDGASASSAAAAGPRDCGHPSAIDSRSAWLHGGSGPSHMADNHDQGAESATALLSNEVRCASVPHRASSFQIFRDCVLRKSVGCNIVTAARQRAHQPAHAVTACCLHEAQSFHEIAPPISPAEKWD